MSNQVNVKNTADEIIEFIRHEIEPMNDLARRQFWGLLAAEVAANSPKARSFQTDSPMPDNVAAGFEKSIVPYGQHKGKRVGDTPLEWFVYLTEHEDHFKKQVRRYLASDRVQRELKKA